MVKRITKLINKRSSRRESEHFGALALTTSITFFGERFIFAQSATMFAAHFPPYPRSQLSLRPPTSTCIASGETNQTPFSIAETNATKLLDIKRA